MVSYTESLKNGPPLSESRVREIVREEITKAFQAFRRQAETYDGGEIRDMAADALSSVLDGTVLRLTCKHEHLTYSGNSCRECGEPVNPFEEETDG